MARISPATARTGCSARHSCFLAGVWEELGGSGEGRGSRARGGATVSCVPRPRQKWALVGLSAASTAGAAVSVRATRCQEA